ncbi:hypothetical protein BGZ61DRAFT_114225 [Ilyonectria robusta]|uniref:uncharacterized protein n=1 Tax=Ilyonectria robusta TaxID=1079257 RepID=UPI001E8EB5B9|nr:uncharacterized protein BGZ61DRAFT_114225 [Ilyonectria robusta]KAH8670036.1 hypothetical protein BGZ61DRAFT_114225 [Ilyonectria robusta]
MSRTSGAQRDPPFVRHWTPRIAPSPSIQSGDDDVLLRLFLHTRGFTIRELCPEFESHSIEHGDLTLGLRYRTTSTRKPCDRSPNASPAIVSGYTPGFTSSRSARGDEETGKRRIDAMNRSCQDLNNLNSTGCYPSPGILAISKFERGRNRTTSAATAGGMPSITASPS